MARTIEDELRRAAQLRAEGIGWDGIARELKRSKSRVSTWPQEYPEFWQAALAKAEGEASRNAAAEGRNELRHQLRDTDKGVRREVAGALMKDHVERAKKRPKKARKPKASGTAIRLAQYVEGLSDDELENHLRDLEAHAERFASAAVAPGSGAGDPPVEAVPERVS
jgi:hypothetical protein